MLNDLIYISTAILLPLIPSFVIYRTLSRYAPTKASLSGTPSLFGFVKGLKIDVQGAGASYFLLVFVIFGYIYTKPQPQQYSSYDIEGRIALSPEETLRPESVQIAVLPPQGRVTPGGVFRATVWSEPSAPLPTLVLSYPGYDSATVELDPTSRYQTPNVSIEGGRISLGDSVTLVRRDESEPPYDPAAEAAPNR